MPEQNKPIGPCQMTSSSKLSRYDEDRNLRITQFKIISQAYRLLSNPDHRCRYDEIQAQEKAKLAYFKQQRISSMEIKQEQNRIMILIQKKQKLLNMSLKLVSYFNPKEKNQKTSF
ncbi:unnamed protein product (macronuclear) [Paramecium tetraurelia]|uniref:J domain-containing protein n=1 Tax=Paramecium tetraurelia TaxID=5888 RepID=A0BSB4_PARTE|nr:uncharacterized protein GSPATT00031662001 [Paramecium tetraurelia]CAK61431.1 unnamed protein product [Paramecium tetraurelia]|eukprot:XP_001428829.1 hypothetical protein (macronuclear) [Paramecium tetraurelia strain d4-2]